MTRTVQFIGHGHAGHRAMISVTGLPGQIFPSCHLRHSWLRLFLEVYSNLLKETCRH